jgi:hypothetical protein
MASPALATHVAAGSAAPRIASSGGIRVPAGTHLVVRNGVIHVRSNGTALRSTSPRPNGSRPVSAQDQGINGDNFNPVPGLGFDEVHWAAVHPQGLRGHGRFPRQFAAFFPFFDGGFMVAPQQFVEDEPSADTQQTDYAPQTDANEPRQRVRYREQAEIIPSADNTQPQKESEQYVFVRRDGTIIFAVGYTWDKGNLRYVTNDGVRKSLALELLDLDATRQFNEQRGLSFRLPA